MAKFVTMTDGIMAYLETVGVRETDVQRRCRAETAEMGRISGMQIAPEEGALLAMLARLMGARRCLEIGVFTGYSALTLALALPPDGTIDACDVSEEYTARARRYWDEAGVESKIRLHLRPAIETLDAFLSEGRAGTYDMAFIDADKTGYDAYYELCLALLRPGGLVAIDNVLWGGAVADPSNATPDTLALRALNAKIAADERVDVAMVHVSDGITLAAKR